MSVWDVFCGAQRFVQERNLKAAFYLQTKQLNEDFCCLLRGLVGKMFTRYDIKAPFIRVSGTQKGRIVLFTTAALLRWQSFKN